MIFEQLSLEYWLAGKPLPWNKHANPDKTSAILFEGEGDMIKYDVLLNRNHKGPAMPHMFMNSEGFVYMIGSDPAKAKSRYFNLKR